MMEFGEKNEKTNGSEVYIFMKITYHCWFNSSLVIEKSMLAMSSKNSVTLNRGLLCSSIEFFVDGY